MPAEITISFNGGEDVSIDCLWTVEAVAVDLTSYVVTADLTWHGGSLALAEGTGITVTDPGNGLFTIALTEAQSAALPLGNRTSLIVTFVVAGVTTKIGPVKLVRLT